MLIKKIIRWLKKKKRQKLNLKRLKALQRILQIPDPGFSEWQGRYITEGEPYLYESIYSKRGIGRTTATMCRVLWIADEHTLDIHPSRITIDNRHCPDGRDTLNVMHEDGSYLESRTMWFNLFWHLYNDIKEDEEASKLFNLDNITLSRQ